MIDKIKHYILAGASLLIGAFLPYLYSFADVYAKNAQIITYTVSIVLLIVGLLIITWIQYQQRMHRVRYAILIFALDKDKRLLTIHNEYHKRLMIPCGIIPSSLTPNEAVNSFMREQVGLSAGDFTSVCLHDGQIPDKIFPSDAQIEFVTKHERHVKLHYAFVYALWVDNVDNLTDKASFKSIDELSKIPNDKGLFSDIFARYKFILSELDGGDIK